MTITTTVYLTTTICRGSGFSRPFAAKYAGVCAWTGLPIFPGDRVRYAEVTTTGERALFSCRAVDDLFCFGSTASDEVSLRWHSAWQRVDSPEAALELTLAGERVDVMGATGQISRLERSGDAFVVAGWPTKRRSQAQVAALLRTALAIRVSVQRPLDLAAEAV